MSYKTILVHVDLTPHAPARIRFAAALANTHGAHLIGVASTGVSRFMNIDNASNFDPAVLASYLDRMNDQARQGLMQYEALARESCTGSWEGRLVADNPEEALVMMSRFTDLVVMSQTDPDNAATGAMRDLPEFMILNAARPVLLLPYAGSHGPLNGKALVAWNGSLEASHALAQALPLLRGASEVLVAQFNAPADPGLREQEADLVAWLARHGVTARVEAQQQTAIDEGNALLSLAADRGVGLLVMGAYGHTRLRELVLGGVTRTMLQSMTIPVFMAH